MMIDYFDDESSRIISANAYKMSKKNRRKTRKNKESFAKWLRVMRDKIENM